MTEPTDPIPTFNLWTDLWIPLECREGGTERLSIEQTLLHASEYSAIYDPSPLVVVGIHRLLTAVLQSIVDPERPADLRKLWSARQFPPQKVKGFGRQYSDRFDLFSARTPFLQSGDLPLQPGKEDDTKTVSYLTTETSQASANAHYRHRNGKDEVFCPSCAAAGLVTIPPFASSGGRGIKPSINGVPPIYVIPGGKTLFDSLAASLVLPPYRPSAASPSEDAPWWERPACVERGKEVLHVGYLQSLTFPARRVRLHPERLGTACTRCGQEGEWGVRTMIFEMGESRPRDSAFWFDPFAAYRLPDSKSDKLPTPIRPVDGKALWREYAGLFLPQSTAEAQRNATVRPSVLYQLAGEDILPEVESYPFRCVGLRTDMKAKVFEWIDASFDVPASLLDDEEAGQWVREATQFAGDCAKVMAAVFHDGFGGPSKKAERHKALKGRMLADYWADLAGPFRGLVLELATVESREAARSNWADGVLRAARRRFGEAAAAVGDGAVALRHQVEAQRKCELSLFQKRNDYLPKGVTNA